MPTGDADPTTPAGGEPPTYPGSPYTCTICGCLCDDLELTADSGRVVEARWACELARPFLVGMSTIAVDTRSPRIAGRDASAEEAVAEAARILAGSRAPLILGLRRSTNEAVRKAVALADQLGAAIEIGEAPAWARIAAMQRGGAVGATLGEVKARADVIVYWACDPVATHPRHLERYSADAMGRFASDGRAGRRVVVVDREKTATADRADLFLQVDPERELDLLLVLRALWREVALDPRRVLAATGHPLGELQELAEILQGARYGAWFVGAFAGRGPVGQAEARHQAVTALVRELGRRTRFVALGLGEAGNAHGAESVLGWQSGFAPGVDFGGGFPESLPGETSVAVRLANGEFDCTVVVGAAALDTILDHRWDEMTAPPWIFVGSPDHEAFDRATVAFPAGTAGVDAAGTFTRVDGVSLPVRAVRPSRSPDEGGWLEAVGKAVAALRTGANEPGTAVGR
ncbi:formylmethanofuran dehydrogenase subunit B [Paludisphaera mucosa]|uniref:Formylmethanofuran dehydrogenase subunit B n=1 Tax=Paludisphaera mucosa TaxID=3030827 RepID=A0ABT6FFP8_9BACT|nr:formylmethanofuran dehydrogenase subunit B [Paludisphaera mucosa]MDG3006402.1 formylmethanofuran dehydrogenase subunit B [Paludisphaera mucosa]